MKIKNKFQDPVLGVRRSMDQGIKNLSVQRKSPCNSARGNGYVNQFQKSTLIKKKDSFLNQASISLEQGKLDESISKDLESHILSKQSASKSTKEKNLQSMPTEINDQESHPSYTSSYNYLKHRGSHQYQLQKSPKQTQSYQSKDRLILSKKESSSQQYQKSVAHNNVSVNSSSNRSNNSSVIKETT